MDQRFSVTATGKVSCCTLPNAPFFGGFWGPMLAYESILFGLALHKGYTSTSFGDKQPHRANRLIDSLIKHSITYFLV